MTVQEFKEKYPYLSHLEGNALWDAMSKAVFMESGGKVIEIKDEADLEKILRERFTDPKAYEDRFGEFSLFIPTGLDKNNVPYVSFEVSPEASVTGEANVKKMSFDELAEWAKKQPPRKNKK